MSPIRAKASNNARVTRSCGPNGWCRSWRKERAAAIVRPWRSISGGAEARSPAQALQRMSPLAILLRARGCSAAIAWLSPWIGELETLLGGSASKPVRLGSSPVQLIRV